MSEQVRISVSGPIMEIAMNRPPVNAINLALSRTMYAAFKELNDSPDLRVAILSSSGNDKNIFSAGWDLKAFAAGESLDPDVGFDLGPGGLGGLPEFFSLYKPVVAAVAGGAIGGGFELALGADVIICAEDAYFWLPEMQRGFLPDGGAIQKLHHRIPYNVTMDLILTGRKMFADEAKHWGLVRDVVPADRLMSHVREVAADIARGAPLVAIALKEFMRKYAHSSPEAAHAAVRRAWVGKSDMPLYQQMLQSDDFREGSVAFAEKRDPSFKG
ncbi:MAG: carnitinyl-CoA dehydratase [Cereibacter sphaeroides]|uniref:Carnitinyl-CoA dehydratase n=1 Tax=Cereibacter sphaeroides TaxID=1063 RepID=A0A2W5S295_CERSP|nr:MAG: carnitinyl-CoA dehydratase [Cereibacter sphaeroides]